MQDEDILKDDEDDKFEDLSEKKVNPLDDAESIDDLAEEEEEEEDSFDDENPL